MNSCYLVAYIDPGTGAIVLQAVVASLLALGVVGRRFLLAPIRLIFGRGSSEETPTDEQNTAD